MTAFTQGQQFSLAAGSSTDNIQIDQIKTGDFNGDGKIDIVVSHIFFGQNTTHLTGDNGTTPSPLQVFLGDGNGNFVDQTSTIFISNIPYTHYVTRFSIADFNNDGVSDIFCVESGPHTGSFTGGQNRLLLSSSGGLTDASNNLPQVLKFNHQASVADINGDGRLDILTNATIGGNDLQINDGSGHYVLAPNLMPNLTVTVNGGTTQQTNTASSLIDVNNDGHLDMILGCWGNPTDPNANQVFLSDSKGSFANSFAINLPRSGLSLETVVDIQPIDLNGDNLPDFVMAVTTEDESTYYQIPYVQFLVNDGNGNFHDDTASRFSQSKTSSSTDQNWYKNIYVVDLNHDGYSDMVLDGYKGTKGTSKVLLNDGTGKFTDIMDFPTGQMATVGDINNDGMTDVISASTWGNDNYTVWYNSLSNQHVYKANFGGDNLLGSIGNDKFYVRDGADTFNGNGGIDTCVIAGNKSGYTITVDASSGTVIVQGASTKDTMTSVERLQFADKRIALDVANSGNTGRTLEFIGAIAYNLVTDKGAIGTIQGLFDNGYSMSQVSQAAINAGLIKGLAGSSSNADLAKLVWKNVIGTTADAATTDVLVAFMDGRSASLSQADFLAVIAGLAVNDSHIGLTGLAQTGVEYSV